LEIARGHISPEVFLFRHNGVTLTASVCEEHSESLILVEPQVLNGAQTVTTLYRICEELMKRNEYTKVVEGRLARLFVIGRVITNASKEFISSVTIASNRQNPIMPWHLRANDDVQAQLQAWFRDHIGIYYEVQEGAFNTMNEDERESHGILDTEKYMEIRRLAQTFLAVDGQIDRMQQLKIVFEDDGIYSRVFCAGRMSAKPEEIVVCYKIERRIGKMLRLLGGDEKYSFVKGGRSLIWALLCQAFLNDGRRTQLAGSLGRELAVTSEFTSEMERLAKTRVKPLLSWIVNESEHKDQVRSENYGFLSTRKIFEQTLEVARQRWAWRHHHSGGC